MRTVKENCELAKASVGYLASLCADSKNKMLSLAAKALVDSADKIIEANGRDLEKNSDKPKHMLDRLALNLERIRAMSEGLLKLTELPDPVGEIIEEWTNAAGLLLRKVRVPFGVIGIIYEARPNVTADAIGLCIKSGNAVVLRGSKDAVESNKAIVETIKSSLSQNGFETDFIQLVEELSHESSEVLMAARGLIDVLIPRGSAKLINAVVEKSIVPVIETGTGNCHTYIHESADYDIAEKIILNAKLRRPSVCNALESILIDESVAEKFLPGILTALTERGVEIRGCAKTKKIFPGCKPASEEDYYTEFLSLTASCKVVKDYNEAIAHINKYGSGHSEAIAASDEKAVSEFMKYVDSAAVYHNASTAFTDGFEFGLGAEMGISTQKLHARGPLGLKELTCFKYRIYGNGQIRK